METRRMRALSHLQNRVAPINRLPEELLVSIFKEVTRCTSSLKHPMAPLIFVCKYWHRLCLSAPCLWTTINLARPKGMITTLDLSGRCPIALHLRFGFRRRHSLRESHLAAIKENIQRTFEISTCMQATYLKEFVAAIWREPAPLLTRLHLEADICVDGVCDIIDLGSAFAGQAPNLRSIYLQDVMIRPSTAFFTGLHSLHLRYEWRNDAPSLRDFHTILPSNPDLQTLTLDISLNNIDIDEEGAHSMSVLPLDKLESLNLYLNPSSIKWFLSHLKISSKCHIMLNAYDPDDDLTTLEDIIPVDCPAVQGLDVFRHLRIQERAFSFIITSSSSPTLYGQYDFFISFNVHPSSCDVILRQLEALLPIKSVVSLTFEGFERYISVEAWKSFLNNLPQLAEIKLIGLKPSRYARKPRRPPPDQINALKAIGNPDGPNEGDAALWCPNLRSLTLDHFIATEMNVLLITVLCVKYKLAGKVLHELSLLDCPPGFHLEIQTLGQYVARFDYQPKEDSQISRWEDSNSDSDETDSDEDSD